MEALLLILSLIRMAHAGFTVVPGKCTVNGDDQTSGEMHQEGEVTHFKCAQICLTKAVCTGYEWNKVTNHCTYHTRRIDAIGGDGDENVECYFRQREEWCQKTNEFYPHGGETCKTTKNVPTIEECRTQCIEEAFGCNAVVYDNQKKKCWHYCGVPAVKSMPTTYKETRKMWGRLCGDGGCSSDSDCPKGKEFCEFTDKVGHCSPLPEEEASFLAVVELSTTKEKLHSYGVYLLALVGIVAVVYRGLLLIRGGQRKETYNQIRTHEATTYTTA